MKVEKIEKKVIILYDPIECILHEFANEYIRAKTEVVKRNLASTHEGYAVILEELDEAWDAIKANDLTQARREMIQVGAMVLRFILEAPEKPE